MANHNYHMMCNRRLADGRICGCGAWIVKINAATDEVTFRCSRCGNRRGLEAYRILIKRKKKEGYDEPLQWRCSVCGELKEYEEFYRASDSICIKCLVDETLSSADDAGAKGHVTIEKER